MLPVVSDGFLALRGNPFSVSHGLHRDSVQSVVKKHSGPNFCVDFRSSTAFHKLENITSTCQHGKHVRDYSLQRRVIQAGQDRIAARWLRELRLCHTECDRQRTAHEDWAR